MLQLQACGFSPVYGTQSQSLDVREKLASVDVLPIQGRYGQILKSTVENQLNPLGLSPETKYQLKVTIVTSEAPVAIERDRTITRYQVIVTARYTLIDADTGETIRRGSLKRENGYDKTVSEYSTFVVRKESIEQAVEAVAKDLSMMVTSSVIRQRNKP